MKVYTVTRHDGLHVFSTAAKAIRDICYNDVEVELEGELNRVTDTHAEKDLIDLLKKRHGLLKFMYQDSVIWLEVKEVK